MQALLILFDRLPYGLLGCYGNMEAATPGFDRLAAGGVTFDLCFTTNAGVDGSLGGLAESIALLASRGTAVRIVQQHGATAATNLTSAICGVYCSTIAENTQPLADRVDAALQSSPNHRGVGESELAVVSLTGIPTEDPVDQMRGVNVAVAEADAVIARVLERLDRSTANAAHLLLVTAATGVPQRAAAASSPEPLLRDSSIHVPLLGRVGSPWDYGVRCNALVTLGDVAATLSDWFGHEGIETNEIRSLLPPARGDDSGSRDAVIIRGPGGEVGIRTADWYLTTRLDVHRSLCERRSAALETAALFSKPGDSWEVLDVSAQSPEIVDALVEQLMATSAESP